MYNDSVESLNKQLRKSSLTERKQKFCNFLLFQERLGNAELCAICVTKGLKCVVIEHTGRSSILKFVDIVTIE